MKADRDFITFLKGMMKGKRTLIFIMFLILLLAFAAFSKGCDSEKTQKNETEARIEELCSVIEGVGECRVMVTFEKTDGKEGTDRVYSVAVICEGADNITVRARVVELITSLYGIGSNRVSVIKLEK